MRFLTSFLAASLFNFANVACQQATCYWPTGAPADPTFWKPCLNNVGTCCYFLDDAHRDLCYGNGFCYSLYFGSRYRGACTEKSWKSGSGCAQQCLNSSPAEAININECSNRKQCCGSAENVTSCCANGGGFDWNNSTFINIQAEIISKGATQTTSTTSSTRPTSGSLTNTMDTITREQCSKDKLALGAGLGAPLGASILAILVLSLLIVQQRRKENKQPYQQSPQMTVDPYIDKARPPIDPVPSELHSNSQIHELEASRDRNVPR